MVMFEHPHSDHGFLLDQLGPMTGLLVRQEKLGGD